MGTSKLLHLEDQLPRPKMKLSLIAALFLAATSATGSSVGDIVQAMLPYCTHGQMRREVKAALEECSASCSSDETATEGYYDATTDGYYWDKATTTGDYWDEATTARDYWDEATTARDYWNEATIDGDYWNEATTAGDYWDEATTDGNYWDEATTDGHHWDEATTDGYYWDEATTDGYYNVRSLPDKKFRKMFRKECPATHYMQNKFYGGYLSAYKVLACVEERMNAVPDGETSRSGATLRYGCAGNVIRSGAAVRSGCEEVNDCIYRIESQILAEPQWCSAGLDVFPMVTAMCNSIAFMDSCFDHMRQQFFETNGSMDQTTTTAYYAPDGAGPVRSLH